MTGTAVQGTDLNTIKSAESTPVPFATLGGLAFNLYRSYTGSVLPNYAALELRSSPAPERSAMRNLACKRPDINPKHCSSCDWGGLTLLAPPNDGRIAAQVLPQLPRACAW